MVGRQDGSFFGGSLFPMETFKDRCALPNPQFPMGSVDVPYKGSDPLDRFFESKRRILAKSVEDVVSLIEERKTIKYDNFEKIDYDSCCVQTKLYELDHWPPESKSTVERKRSAFEKELLNFEREKRMEEVACWRDVARMRGDLRELMFHVEEEKRRQSLIQGD